jgi:UDP-N-acetylglucosamine 4,6-dehydratase/5-epimerase
VIAFNERQSKPLKEGLSSANTKRLTEEEVLAIIDNPPAEEQ